MLDDGLGTRQFPVNHAMWKIFMNFCMWATVHFSKNGRVHSNVFFGKWMFAPVQKDFTTVQNHIPILQGEELGGLTEQSDWTDSPWRSYS